MHLSVRWRDLAWWRGIISPKIKNAENSFKIYVIRPVNLPFIQEEMTLWWISDETARRTGNNAKFGFEVRDTLMKVRRREILYRSTESVKRLPAMTYVALFSKTFMNPKCHQRAHIAKFYGRLRLIRSVLIASKFSVLTFTEILILWIYYTIPFGFSLFWHFWGINFQFLKLLCLAKDHWRGFSTRNAHIVHIVN